MLAFTLLRVETPVKYWVRLEQEPGRSVLLSMARHYSGPAARAGVEVLESGRMVAVLGPDGVVKRARVVRVVQRARPGGGGPDHVEVFTVAEGGLEVVRPAEVYNLPER